MTPPPILDFEVLVDDEFTALNNNPSLTPVGNKRVLSALNDFEEGEWRYRKFHRFVLDSLPLAALSAKERQKLWQEPHSLIAQASRALRLLDKDTRDLGAGSELAEIVLYGLMARHYHALPVVPKIFYKQNSRDYAKGADSVHVVVADGNFTVWFGEAKFYDDIANARLDTVVASVAEMLHPEKLSKETSIITNIGELCELVAPELSDAIRTALDAKRSIDEWKPRLHVPILLLHQCSITNKCTEMTAEYRGAMRQYHLERAQAYFSKQISEMGATVRMYERISFHLILLPVPEKAKVVKRFIESVEYYKAQ